MAQHSNLNGRQSWMNWPTLLAILIAIALVLLVWAPIERWSGRGEPEAPTTAPVTQTAPESKPADNSANTAAPAETAPATPQPATPSTTPAPATGAPAQQ